MDASGGQPLRSCAGAKAGPRVKGDCVQRHRAVQAPAAVLQRARLDVGEQRAAQAALLAIGVDEQRAQARCRGVELRDRDDLAARAVDRDGLVRSQRLAEQGRRIAEIDGVALGRVLVVAAAVVDRAPDQPQHLGQLVEAHGARAERQRRQQARLRRRRPHAAKLSSWTDTETPGRQERQSGPSDPDSNSPDSAPWRPGVLALFLIRPRRRRPPRRAARTGGGGRVSQRGRRAVAAGRS